MPSTEPVTVKLCGMAPHLLMLDGSIMFLLECVAASGY
jgi:hypothetical protein